MINSIRLFIAAMLAIPMLLATLISDKYKWLSFLKVLAAPFAELARIIVPKE